jgi:hypothetical protein
MGMYSFFVDEEIEVTDWEGLKKFLKKFEELYPDWNGIMSTKAMIKSREPLFGEPEEKEYFTFSEWNDIKLISYWYDEELIFLTCIAKYLNGNVEFEFESKDEAGSFEFKDGKCIITTGRMEWSEWKADDDIRDKKKIPADIKKLLILNSLEDTK